MADPVERKALVLSGGGARGAYEAGVVSQLYANGETFDIICGTSIGAINGSLIAQRPNADTLRNIWNAISKVGVIKEIPFVQAGQKVLTDLEAVQHDGDLKKIGDLLHTVSDAGPLFPVSQALSITGGLDPAPVTAFLQSNLNYAQVQLPLIFATTNLTNGSSQVFYWFPTGWPGAAAFVAAEPDAIAVSGINYAEAVRSSGSIPIAFPPVAISALPARLAGSQFVDGGVANNTPIGQAIHAGATHVTVVFMDPATDAADHYPSGNLIQIAAACYAVMSQTILQADFDLALGTNKEAAANPHSGKRVINVREFRPKAALPLTVLDFDKQDLIDRAFALGVADANTPPAYRT